MENKLCLWTTGQGKSSFEPRRTGCVARISPASQVWYSRIVSRASPMPFVFTQGYKMLLRFKLQILSYEENVLHCGYTYTSQLKRDRRYVGRSNCHDHRIQIQMFLRKTATGGQLHNQTMKVQSASTLSVCVSRAEKILVRLSLQNANLELLSSWSISFPPQISASGSSSFQLS